MFIHVIQRQYFDVLAQPYDITLNPFGVAASWTDEGISETPEILRFADLRVFEIPTVKTTINPMPPLVANLQLTCVLLSI